MSDLIKEQTPLMGRLSLLPVKVAVPFKHLLKAGHISPDHLGHILDAGDLAGTHQHLLAFAVAFHALHLVGVPILDVIRMAKEQGRRVNLHWSEKRWRTEHERLSRAATLQRLSGENTRYDVSEYAKHLPERFPGYLIKSSRRLGMEGLRQRHCVASYHNRLLMKNSAIAAVFVGGMRWTVELMKTHNAERPLKIWQIRSRFNRIPEPRVKRDIHDLLGIAQANTSPVEGGETRTLYIDNLQRVLPVLRQLEIKQVLIHFDGGGDSGSIEYLEFDGKDNPPQNPQIEIFKEQKDFVDGRWQSLYSEQEVDLVSALEELAYDYIEGTGVDWYNNEGGFADLIIDTDTGMATMDVDVRVYHSETTYYSSLDIATGETVE